MEIDTMTFEEERDILMDRNINLGHELHSLTAKHDTLRERYDALVTRFEALQDMYWKLQDRHHHVQETLMREVSNRNISDYTMNGSV